MRNLKKVLALVIAFSMMLSVVAFAGFNDVAADADYAGAVELLSALDIIVGDDLGNFNPDKTISRAEMAAIVCRIKGLEASANAAKGATNFSDVAADHWASGYVNVANQNGIVAGKGDGTFGPEEEVSYEAAVKMVVSALGFEPMAAQKGGWPTGYLVVANTYKISEGVSGSTRADVAVLVSNALSTPMMDQTIYGADAEFEILDGKKDRDYRTLLTDMDIYVATGILMDTEVDEAYFTATEDSDDLEFEEGDELTFEINGSNIADYQFQNVDVYVEKDARKDYNVVAVVPGVIGETFPLLSDDVKSVSDSVVEYYVDAATSSKTKEIKLEVGTVVYNKQLQGTEGLGVADIAAMDDVELVFIENTGDTKYDVLVATKYTSELLEYVDADKNKITLGGRTIEVDLEDEDKTYIFVDDAGNELTLADFAEDDVIAYVLDADKATEADYIKIIKLSNAAVTGVVEEAYTSNGDSYIVIDGEEYKVDTSAEADGTVSTEEGVCALQVSDEGIFYVGMTGKVIYFDGDAAGKNYGYVLEVALSESNFSALKFQVKLLTKDGGVAVYNTTEDATEEIESIFGLVAKKDGTLSSGERNNLDFAVEANAKRIVEFKTNAKGEIKKMEKAVLTETAFTEEGEDEEYNGKTQMIADASLEDDILVFVVSDEDPDNAYVADINYLVDESEYKGAVYAETNGEVSVMIVTEGDSPFSVETGVAIATKVTTTKDAEDNDVTKVTYVQDGEEGSIIFDDDSKAKTAEDITDIEVGTAFVFNATADGVVTNYAVIAGVFDSVLDVYALENSEGVEVNLGKDVEIIYGYISSTERRKTSKGETIEISDIETGSVLKTVSVASSSNKYTYNDAGRNTVIEVGDFMAEDAYFFDEVTEEYTPVVVRLVDGYVADIYTSTARQTFAEEEESTGTEA